MKFRSTKIRSLAVLPVLAVGCLGLAGCDSKAGAAAVVNGHRISEKTVSSYLTPQAKDIQSNGRTMPARTFVLRTAVLNATLDRLLATNGGDPTGQDLNAAKQSALQGGSEQSLIKQVADLGLSQKFEPVIFRNLQLLTVLRQRIHTDADFVAAVKKAKNRVSVSPRYGSWDSAQLELSQMGLKQLPSMVKLDGLLPGDAKQTS